MTLAMTEVHQSSGLADEESKILAEEGEDIFDEILPPLTRGIGKLTQLRPRAPTKIRFSNNGDTKYPTLGRWEYTDEETDSCFNTEAEKVKSQLEIISTVKVMRKAPRRARDLEGDEFDRYIEENLSLCTRGIEDMKTKESREKKKMHRNLITQVVLDEQERQRNLGMHDSGEIANGASLVSAKSSIKAATAAHSDALYAELRRRSLPAQYAKTLKNMFFVRTPSGRKIAVDNLEEDSNHRRKSRRRSSISYEKHDGVVLEEICKIVEEENESEENLNQDENVESSTGQTRRNMFTGLAILTKLGAEIKRGLEDE